MSTVSIIVPVYNSEKYLSECIESIIRQTHKPWELLLIDDGSTDFSGAICDKYSEKDSRIRVFHKANTGVSSARNVGIANATGKWVYFADADDMLYPRTLETLVSIAEKENLDVLQFSSNREYVDGQKTPQNTIVLNSEKYISAGKYRVSVWATFSRREIIKNNAISFNERLKFGEDQIFVFEIFKFSKRIKRIGEVLYFYRNNAESAMNSSKAEYLIDSVNIFFDYKFENPLAETQCNEMLRGWFLSLIASDASPSEVKKIYKKVPLDDGKSGKLKGKYKIAILLIKLNFSLGLASIRIIKKIAKYSSVYEKIKHMLFGIHER